MLNSIGNAKFIFSIPFCQYPNRLKIQNLITAGKVTKNRAHLVIFWVKLSF